MPAGTDDQVTAERIDADCIQLRGVRVHNLVAVDVDIPLHSLTVITGVSGSGKSSLAFDTLYAEGCRRYIESFSPATRRHLERLEKPNAERIDRIPPAIGLRQNSISRSTMATASTVTEINDLLRVLLARTGRIICHDCKQEVVRETPLSVVREVADYPDGLRFQPGFSFSFDAVPDTAQAELAALMESGFTRVIVLRQLSPADPDKPQGGETTSLQNLKGTPLSDQDVIVIADRLTAGRASAQRLTESLESCFRLGNGRCCVLTERNDSSSADEPAHRLEIDGRLWNFRSFSDSLECDGCGVEYSAPEPALLNFRSPLGACPRCRGTGTQALVDLDHLIPDQTLSLNDGAIAMFQEGGLARERTRLLESAAEWDIPCAIPCSQLTDSHRNTLIYGPDPEQPSGLVGIFDRLERRRGRSGTARILARWSSLQPCPSCHGSRLRPQAEAVRIADGPDHSRNLADLENLTATELTIVLNRISDSIEADGDSAHARHLLDELLTRLEYLQGIGLGFLKMNRPLTKLSRGESQRLAMAGILGSRLVDSLFVLDEPSAGLHAADLPAIIKLIQQLRDAGNTVVVVEHEAEFIRAADHIIDVGPKAGTEGGRIVFSGPPGELPDCSDSVTAQFLDESGRKPKSETRSAKSQLTLSSCRHHTLQNVSVTFPLGGLCVVAGVSGSGKSSLVEQTLYPALCRQIGVPCEIAEAGDFESLTGADAIAAVQLVDDSPLQAGRRSNAATWMKVFSEIRRLFSETPDARNRNLTAGHFSFNTDTGGRCPKCEGTGTVEIDMQFMADVAMTCPDCRGTRYQRHLLDVSWRSRSIADVLAMTAAEAFSFFRGEPKIQKRLRTLKDVGLDYLTLGQPLSTLSGGESQRLKLAAHLATAAKNGSVLILNEPTTGLHPADVQTLLECFDSLISVGHSLIVIEHDLDVIRAADHVVELGPGAGPDGGCVIATGTAEQIAQATDSVTGRYL